MQTGNAIEVSHVTKSFKVFLDKGNTIKERALFRSRRRYEYRQVLKGISFRVERGEAVGLIGQNGCGKSTTLKLLTKILYPDSGTIEIRGRVSSLIELGAGFHPDLSGRENIYINAAIFGLSKKEIDTRLDDIIAFSELEEYIDNPVRTYSSGMYMRLAFSVAINVDADVLLIDEILAVGDANFQAKCFQKLKEIKAGGTTIVIVSHSLGQIEQICERSIWIHEGAVKEAGKPREVHPIYLDYMGKKRECIAQKEAARIAEKEKNSANQEKQEPSGEQNDTVFEHNSKRWGNGKARIIRIELLDKNKKKKALFETETDITVKLDYKIYETVLDAVVGIGIFRSDGVYCYGTNTRLDKMEKYDLEKDGTVEIILKNIVLMPGSYTLDLAIESETGIPVDYWREAAVLELYSTKDDVGLVRVAHEWNFVLK